MSKTLSVTEVAKRLGVSTETVRRACYANQFDGVYRKSPLSGSPWRIPETAVIDFERRRRMGQ